MPTIFKQKKSNETLGPIRGSVKLLLLKITFLILFLDLFFFILLIILNFLIATNFTFHLTLTLTLIFVYLFIKFIQIVLILYNMILWSRTTYYINGSHLIVHTGVFNLQEDSYDLATIRSADVKQSLFERIFNFGDIVLKTSASGGYQVVVVLKGISRPIEVERKINAYF